jgi:23S rRNA (uracil1939-C5)-methyltransferase
MICRFASECSGCTGWGISLEEQQHKKRQDFLNLTQGLWSLPLPNIEIHSLGPGFLRDRLDFTLEGAKFGLKKQGDQVILDLPECLQISMELQEFLTQFRKVLPPIKKGSVRLRVGPQGQKGLWLDFANRDIQTLFLEKTSLKQLLDLAFVEVGQRRKKLVWEEGPEPRFRLKDPELKVWTQTFSRTQPIPLWGYVSSFTQTGIKANKKISELLDKLVRRVEQLMPIKTVYEFGAGLGTLTLPVLKTLPKAQMKIFDSDGLSLQGLKRTLQCEGLEAGVEIFSGDFQKEFKNSIPSADLLLLNPPRSGVGHFIQQISSSTNALIYMSCYAESMIKDCKDLKDQGFQLTEIHMIDQFPQSSHAEWLTLWVRNP